MQIYTFKCQDCGKEFDVEIYTPLQVLEIRCPECGSEELEVINIVNICSPFG
ncbi:FmdB family zinc ribbon protein [Desulfurobacterium atlanticum]|uniref:Putative regulatory protein, FmdB family n=1 Tax=Desulfurobacterium atlanticum TaxID=240169 RepID=A0A238XLJ5_9BACT|nr:zinc ribbon domain-containing protein [Desulfurobacterium atlanticum]SNR59461.1 putative regulatory protein, FmdB family [Desulfurobacterium atlanticum]